MSIVEVLDAASGLPFRPPVAGVQLTLSAVDGAMSERWDVLARGPASVVHVRAAFFPARVEVVVCDGCEHDEERSVARLVVPLGGSATLELLDESAREFASEPWTMSVGAVARTRAARRRHCARDSGFSARLRDYPSRRCAMFRRAPSSMICRAPPKQRWPTTP